MPSRSSEHRFARRVIALGVALSCALLAGSAAADCPLYPECARDHCDPSCCNFNGGGTCDYGADGNESCSTGGCILDTYCWPPCFPKDDTGVKTDAKYEAGKPDSGTDTTGTDTSGDATSGDSSIDGGADTSLAPDTHDELPTVIPDDQICYVFVHGSEPTDAGPSAKAAAWATYWGDEPWSLGAAGHEGAFIHALLEASDAKGPFDLPTTAPAKHWASVSYDGTWPLYWSALDVLQQLEAIEDERVPTSLEYVLGDDGVLGYHHGLNYCKKGDYLVTIGHSLGNLAVAFLLENFHSEDPNYDFLRTGGLNANAPFYDPSTRTWIDRADRKNPYNNLEPSKTGRVPWTTPSHVDPHTLAEIPAAPDPNLAECFYPPVGDTTPYHFPYVAKTDGTQGIGICRGDPGTRTVGQIVERIAYHYSVAGPFRGTPAADCLCRNGYPSDVPDMCKKIRDIADGAITGPLIAKFKGSLAPCNPALETMQTTAPYLVQHMGSSIARHVYLFGGTEPTPLGVQAGPITLAFNPIDCLSNGNPDQCQLTGYLGFGPGSFDDGYPQALNDTAVPIASAMACDVDVWSTAAKMSVSSSGTAAFSRGLCVGSEKIWPGWATNDTVFAMHHMSQRSGAIQREAYATPGSFWTHVQNVIDTPNKYEAGQSLIFGYVSANTWPGCFHRPPVNQFNKAICTKSDPASYTDLRQRFEGCSPQCVDAGYGVSIIRQHRSVGHVIGIEEHYAERRAREF